MENHNSSNFSFLGVRPLLHSTPMGNLSSNVSRLPVMPADLLVNSHSTLTSSQSRAGKPVARVPTPPKPKFTPEEQLNILKRLKSRDFIRKVGIQQFQLEKDLTGTVHAKSGNATGGNDSSKGDEYEVPTLPPLSSPSQPLPNFAEFLGGPEENVYAGMPDHIKLFDKLMVLHINAFKMLYTHATRSANATFARVVKPRNIRSLVNRVVQVTRILQKFMKLSPWDKAQTFMPSKIKMRGPGQRRYYLHNPVMDRNKTRLAIIKASQVFEQLRQRLTGGKPDDDDLNMKMERFRKLLESLEGNKGKLSELTKKLDKIFDVAEKLEEDNDSKSESLIFTFDSDSCFADSKDNN